MTESRGTLVLVVGPSGAGKDSLIAAARAKLGPGNRFVFPRRLITRLGASGDEGHVEIDERSFEQLERDGKFALSWRAHGLAYGIPATIVADLASGKHAVINASRTIVPEARRRFEHVFVVALTAPKDVRVTRLRMRAREATGEIYGRVEREHEVDADVVIANDGPLERAVASFLAVLSEIENPPPAP